MTIKGKPDIDAFLDGGAVDTAHKATSRKRTKKEEPVLPQRPARVYREQKIFRLPIDLIDELRDQAYERSKASGTRVTETSLVEEALKAFFKK
jgi:hypothetical protein